MLISVVNIINKDLNQVEEIIRESLENEDNKFAKEIIDYLLNSKGKMLRPILTLLFFYSLCKKPTQTQINNILKVSAAIEIIHMASLVHDDVIDDGETRRMQKTINKKWGNEVAVVLGVYLYSVSLRLISEVGSLDVLSYLSGAVFSMCNGELIQLDRRKNENFDEDRYKSIISAKTADLFTSSSLCAASIAASSDKDLSAVQEFSHQLGQLFQFSDDYLDLKDSEGLLKKDQLQDLAKGVYTLPFKYVLDISTEDEKKLLLNYSKDAEKKFLNLLREKTNDVRYLTNCNKVKKDYVEKALKQIECLPQSQYTNALSKLLAIVAGRIK